MSDYGSITTPADPTWLPAIGGRGGDIDRTHSYNQLPQANPNAPQPVPLGQDRSNLGSDGIIRDLTVPDGMVPGDFYKWRYALLESQKQYEDVDVADFQVTGSPELYDQILKPAAPPRVSTQRSIPVFRYTSSDGNRWTGAGGNGMEDGKHFSMARAQTVANTPGLPVQRFRIIPRNVPTPLDDQFADTSATSSANIYSVNSDSIFGGGF